MVSLLRLVWQMMIVIVTLSMVIRVSVISFLWSSLLNSCVYTFTIDRPAPNTTLEPTFEPLASRLF